MGEKIINHFCHEHPLILTQNIGCENPIRCYACKKLIVSEWVYVCVNQHCNRSRSFFHKRCAELPTLILHPSHPLHPLHLIEDLELGYRCNLCRHYFTNELRYRCQNCNFDIDITCERLEIDELLGEKCLEHPSHLHPLTLMMKPASLFSCDACGTEDRDMAYLCSTCDLWIHKTCALLPASLETDLHHHQLSLSFCFPIRHRKYRYRCSVCEKGFNTTCWVYYCGDCRYFAHLKCATSPTQPDVLKGDKNDGSDLIQFPLSDTYKELITPFVEGEKGVDNIPGVNDLPATIKMPETTESNSLLFNYHKHPLSLVSESHDDDEEDEASDSDDKSKICSLCVTPISSPPYYECIVCRYFVHSLCCMLPKTLSSSSLSSPNSPHLYGDCSYTQNKNHEFTLFTSSEEWDVTTWYYCNLCDLPTNGMMYRCEECRMVIDVKCAALPTTIRHVSHLHHKLTKTRLPKERDKLKACYGCGYYYQHPSIVYLCSSDGCEFGLDLKCFLLPPSVGKHTSIGDKHSLQLTYDASINHPDKFYCEVCEVEMHPKRWMYYCRECDASFHTTCLVAASGRFRNIKFGRRFEFVGIHPHPLTFNYVTIKKRCNLCGLNNRAHGHPGFECASCYYVVCWQCVFAELRKISLS